MISYIVFLRGINVSGQKKIKMADLRESLAKKGFDYVKTYIQSGNIIVASKERPEEVVKLVEKSIVEDFGFEVPAIALTEKLVKDILDAVPFQSAEDKNLYFSLLFKKPDSSLVDTFNGLHFENEDFFIANSCVFLNCKKGAGKAKLNNNLIENKLKVVATTRNLNTMRKMLEMVNQEV